MKFPQNIWKLVYMNFILMIHLSLCLALISLLPQIAEQNGYTNLGNYAILAIYFAEIFFNLLATVYLKNKKFNLGFTFQAILVVPSFFASKYYHYLQLLFINCYKNDQQSQICNPAVLSTICIATTFLLGAGIGGYFVLQNYYVSQCATSETQELVFSVTYVLMGLSALLSGFYADLMLSLFSRSDFFWISACLEIGFSLLFLFVQSPKKPNIYVAINNQESEIVEESLIADIWKVFKDKTTYIYYPLFWMSGIVIGFEFGLLYQFINQSVADKNYTEQEVNRKTAQVYFFVGLAQTLGAILNGFVKKYMGSKTTVLLYTNLIAVVIYLALVDSFMADYNLTIILGIILGLSDISGQLYSSIIISEVYQDAMPVYGIYFSLQNIAISYMILQATFLKSLHLRYNIIIVIVSQIIVNVAMHYNGRKKK